MRKLVKSKSGSSMLYAIVFFLFMAVLSINLVNAVNANLLDTTRELENEQRVLYLQSVYNIVDEMIEEGSFKNAPKDVKATTTVSDGENQPIEISLMFQKKGTQTEAIVRMQYEGTWYEVVSRYAPTAGDKFQRRACEGLKEVKNEP